MMNKKGFIGLIVLLMVLVIFAIWFAYLFNHQWFGKIDIPGISQPKESGNQSMNDSPQIEGKTPLNTQLNNLRSDVKNLQDSKNREIYDELKK